MQTCLLACLLSPCSSDAGVLTIWGTKPPLTKWQLSVMKTSADPKLCEEILFLLEQLESKFLTIVTSSDSSAKMSHGGIWTARQHAWESGRICVYKMLIKHHCHSKQVIFEVLRAILGPRVISRTKTRILFFCLCFSTGSGVTGCTAQEHCFFCCCFFLICNQCIGIFLFHAVMLSFFVNHCFIQVQQPPVGSIYKNPRVSERREAYTHI